MTAVCPSFPPLGHAEGPMSRGIQDAGRLKPQPGPASRYGPTSEQGDFSLPLLPAVQRRRNPVPAPHRNCSGHRPVQGPLQGGGTVRIGGRMPWGAEVEYAYRAGYDNRGQVSVTHLVDERGYSVILTKPDPDGAGPGEDRCLSGSGQGPRAREKRQPPFSLPDMRHRADGLDSSGRGTGAALHGTPSPIPRTCPSSSER